MPDYRRNQSPVVYPVWYLSLVVLCGFFVEALLQEERFSSLLGESLTPSHDTLWWFLVTTPASVFKSYIPKWFKKIPGALKDQLLAIEGKRLRGAPFLNPITQGVELFATDDLVAVEKIRDKIDLLRN